jgi:phage FluMu protein Com
MKRRTVYPSIPRPKIVWESTSMFTEFVSIIYKCPKCKLYTYAAHKTIDETPISNINRIVSLVRKDEPIHCIVCGMECSLIISSMKCVIKSRVDKYGSSYKGHWECPVGHFGNVYPIPLKRAVEGTGFVRYNNLQKYVQIARGGYPWKCPKCKQILKYVETK